MYSEIVKEYLNKKVHIRTQSGMNIHALLLAVDRETCHFSIPSYESGAFHVGTNKWEDSTVPEKFGYVNTADIEMICDTDLI